MKTEIDNSQSGFPEWLESVQKSGWVTMMNIDLATVDLVDRATQLSQAGLGIVGTPHNALINTVNGSGHLESLLVRAAQYGN